MTNITIYRGLPGAGKSTSAHKLALETGAVLIEQDQFRIRGGEYVFKESDNVAGAFLEVVRAYARFGADMIITGVFATEKSIDKVLTEVYKVKPVGCALCVEVIHCHGKYVNAHNVPKHVIASMESSWEPLAFEIHAKAEMAK